MVQAGVPLCSQRRQRSFPFFLSSQVNSTNHFHKHNVIRTLSSLRSLLRCYGKFSREGSHQSWARGHSATATVVDKSRIGTKLNGQDSSKEMVCFIKLGNQSGAWREEESWLRCCCVAKCSATPFFFELSLL